MPHPPPVYENLQKYHPPAYSTPTTIKHKRVLINLKLIQVLKNSVRCVRSYAKIYLTYVRIRNVCDAHFPSFKIYVMFVTRILFHWKSYVCDKHCLLFKALGMFTTRILSI